MSLLYVTADRVGEASGGGVVTHNELLALREFSDQASKALLDPGLSRVGVLSRDSLDGPGPDPWKWDQRALQAIGGESTRFRLCHIYAGTWPTLVPYLRERGCKVVITIAAHDKEVSREEAEKLGLSFPYTHLTDPKLWQRYIEGYRQADVIVCPSTVAERTVRAYGPEFAKKDIRVIPHGCELPEKLVQAPPSFTVGYMGSFGSDKGVRYLLEAWKRLDYKDGSLLVLAGKDSNDPVVRRLFDKFMGGPLHILGWVDDVSKFYNAISLYVQPSVTEGFGIEVIEAMAHGRPVICSETAGASDVVPRESVAVARDADKLANHIDSFKRLLGKREPGVHTGYRTIAEKHTWPKVREQYKALWKEVLGWR